MKIIFRTLGIVAVLLLIYSLFVSELSFKREEVHTVDGFLDLNEWDSNTQDILGVSGTWEVYAGELIPPQLFTDRMWFAQPDAYLPLNQYRLNTDLSSKINGLWTFRLSIELPEDHPEIVGLSFDEILMASDVYVNNVRYGGSGVVALEDEGYVPRPVAFRIYVPVSSRMLSVVIHVANHDYGFTSNSVNVSIGTDEVMRARWSIRTSLETAAIIVVYLLASYCFIVYRAKIQEESMRYLVLMYTALGTFYLQAGARLIYNIFPFLPHTYIMRSNSILLLMISIMLLLYINSLDPELISRQRLKPIKILYLCFAGISIFMPYTYYNQFFIVLVGFILVISAFILSRTLYLYIAKRKLIGRQRLSAWHLLVLCCHFLHLFSQFLYSNRFIRSSNLGGTATIIFIMSSYMVVAQHFIRRFRRSLHAEKVNADYLTRLNYRFKDPLQNIVHLAEDRKEEWDELKAGEIEATAISLINLLDMTYDMTLLNQGTIELEKVAVQVSVLADVAMESVRFYYPGKELHLINKISKHIHVWGDEDRIRQILYHLSLNAAASMESGTIVFDAKIERNLVSISVADTGSGIAKDQIDSLFEPADAEAKHELGLMASKRIAEMMEGNLELTYTQVGEGSKLTLKLPVADTKAIESTRAWRQMYRYERLQSKQNAEGEDTLKSTKQSILIVDRDLASLNNAEAILHKAGYQVIALQSVDTILDLITKVKPDLLMIDLMLFNTTGLDISREVRSKWSLFEMPILMTAFSSGSVDLRMSLEAGANDFISKPHEAWSLVPRVQTLISLREAMTKAVRSELSFLQAQIKPHFIYNAISTITYFCYTDSKRAAELLGNFSHYLRLAFDTEHQQESVSLKRELELIDAYVAIEKARFGDQFDFETDIDEEAMDVLVPVLSLQPLVENSIKHGMLNKEEKGKIRLSVKLVASQLHIKVTDNGVGMDEETLEHLIAGEAVLYSYADPLHTTNHRSLDKEKYMADNKNAWQGHGVGLSNVRRRLERMEGASISISSIKNVGTEVIIELMAKSA